ncbi:MAG: 5' nucleotidase, NT5C type [Mycobacterium leprae]
MRIGLDLDGVVVNSIPYWIRVLNREAGTNYGPGDLPSSHGTPAMASCSDRHELEMLIAAPPMPGAPEALCRLRAAGHTLVAITHRNTRLTAITRAWLDYWGLTVDQLHCVEGAAKAPVAHAERVDLFIEDSPKNAIGLAEAGIPVLLFAAPYNREVAHPLIRHCEGWDGVLAEVESQAAD